MSDKQAAQNKEAVRGMLTAVVLYSAVPMFFHVGDAGAAPFLFGAVLHMSGTLTSIAVLWIIYRNHHLFCLNSIKVSMANLRRLDIWLAFFGLFGYVLLGVSLNFVDVAVAAIIYETWPIFVIVLTIRLFRKEKRYKKMKVDKWLFTLVAFIGMALVVLSQTEKSINFFPPVGDVPILGIALVLMAALVASLFTPYSRSWGERTAKEATETVGIKEEMFFVIVATLIIRIFGVIVTALMGFEWGESLEHLYKPVLSISLPIGFASGERLAINAFAIALICGVFVSAGGMILRYANALTDNLGINALIYATPMLSLLWLFLLGFVNVPQQDYLVIGSIAIIMANVLINFKSDGRAGYKALMVSLWLCGMVVHIHGADVQLTEYYNAITVAATIFILILSFRTDRMIRRDSSEDALFFSIWRLIPAVLVDEGRIKRARAVLLKLATATSKMQLKRAHPELIKLVTSSPDGYSKNAGGDLAKVDAEMMVEASKQIDMLAHSKQQGRNSAEIISLIILAAVTVYGLLFFAPLDMMGRAGFYANISSFLLASTIIFLLFNVYDLQKDREHSPMLKNGKINFQGTEDKKFEHYLSIATCGAIILIYCVLFWYQ